MGADSPEFPASQYKLLDLPYYSPMRRLCWLLGFAIFIAIPFTLRAQSDQVPPLPVPPDPQQKAQSTDSKPQDTPPQDARPPKTDQKPDYSQEAFVVEQYRSLYRFENDGTGREETIARIRRQRRGWSSAVGTDSGGLQLRQRARGDSLCPRDQGRWQYRQGVETTPYRISARLSSNKLPSIPIIE